MVNRKRQGDYYEKRYMAQLEAAGYWAMQTRASLSPADIIAIRPGVVLIVQVKGSHARIDHLGWNALYQLGERIGAIPLVVESVGIGKIAVRRITGPHLPYARSWPSAVVLAGELAWRDDAEP